MWGHIFKNKELIVLKGKKIVSGEMSAVGLTQIDSTVNSERYIWDSKWVAFYIIDICLYSCGSLFDNWD